MNRIICLRCSHFPECCTCEPELRQWTEAGVDAEWLDVQHGDINDGGGMDWLIAPAFALSAIVSVYLIVKIALWVLP